MDAQPTSPNDWLDDIIISALTSRASDIHFEPERENLIIRFRIDGLLHSVQNLSKFFQDKVASRIKVMAGVNIADHRVPQDGHFEFNYQGIIYNIRVSTLPSLYGETIVLRVFNREDILLKLGTLGMDQEQFEITKKLITSPSGMILITGPAGSGKTTLLYSILHELVKDSINIVTLEDPIEYQMQHIRQSQISEATGLNFARAMRSVLRQDPDIIMLGEIRDAETAQMAIQASLTGILIFSTFHTFDVPALVMRLFEMEIAPSVVGQSIKGVVATRLVRKICDNCKEEYQPDESEKAILSTISLSQALVRGKGCEMCKQKGYLGRTGIFEVIYFDEEIKNSLIEKKSPSFIYELLQKKNIQSLKESAIRKVGSGVTTLDEIIRVMGIIPFQNGS